MSKVLVAGATGYLGGHVTRALHDAGHFVRVLARDTTRLKDIEGKHDEVIVGEATRPETLAGLCDGMDVVFASLGVRHMRRSPTIWDVDWRANLNVVEAARRAGVKHFIFVSVFRGREMRTAVPVAEARERVADALASNGPPFTVLRPTVFFNDMLVVLRMAQAGRVWLLGSGEMHVNPVHGADIAAHVLAAVNAGPRNGHEFRDVGGPQAFTMRDIGALAFQILGTQARYGQLPVDLFVSKVTPFGADAEVILRMLTWFARTDAIAPLSGTHDLRAFFEEYIHDNTRRG